MRNAYTCFNNKFYFHHDIELKPKHDNNFNVHHHRQYEILYFMSGIIEFYIEDKVYTPKPNSLLIIKPGISHGYKSSKMEPYERYVFQFSDEIIDSKYFDAIFHIFSNPEKKYVLLNAKNGEILRAHFKVFESIRKLEQSAIEKIVKNQAHSFLLHLANLLELEEKCEKDLKNEDAVESIIEYLNKTYTTKQTLDSIANRFYINKHHMNKIFKSATNTTVMDYIKRKRISFVQQLIYQGIPVTTAYKQAGYTDYTVFFKAYVSVFKCSPQKDLKFYQNENLFRDLQNDNIKKLSE